MASIILGAAGSAVAGPVGGMLGGAMGSFIDQKIAGHFAKKPALIDLVVEASTYGQVIPVIYGRNKVAGNLIASTILMPSPHSGKGKGGSGKGGGGGSTTAYYTYAATFAVAICRGPIQNVWRVFADSKDIWDMEGPTISVSSSSPLIASGFSSSQWGGVATIYEYGQSNKNNHTQSAVGNIFFYYGTEDQQPDPILQSTFGIGLTPAYRGLAYAVFLNLPLQYFGNRIPNLSFEVNGFYSGGVTNSNSVVNATTVYSKPQLFTGSTLPNQANTGHAYSYNLGSNLIYDCSQQGIDAILGGTGEVYASVKFATDAIATSLGGTPTFTSVTSGRESGPDGNFYIEVGVGGVGPAILAFSPYSGVLGIAALSPNTGTGLSAMNGSGITCWMGSHNYLFVSDNTGLFQIYTGSNQLIYAGNFANGNQEIWYYGNPVTTTPIQLQNSTASTSFAFPTCVTWAEALGLLIILDGNNGVLYTLNLSGAPYLSGPISLSGFSGSGYYRVIYDNTSNTFIFMNFANIYVVSNIATMAIAAHTTANSLNSSTSSWFNYQDWLSNQAPFGNVFVPAGTQVFNLSTTNLSILPISGNISSPFDWTNPPNLNGGPVPTPAAADVPAFNAPMLFSPFQDGAIGYVSTDADGLPQDTGWTIYNFLPKATTLASIVTDICEKCGLTSGQIDVTAATDMCWGYSITSEATGRQSIEPLQEIFLFDMVESNGKLVFRYRQANAASPSSTILEGDLAARELQAGQHPGANPPPKVIETITQHLDLPHIVFLRYKTTSGDRYTIDFSFEIAGQYARRLFTAVQKANHISINTPVVLDDGTAQSLVTKILYLQYINRTRLQFNLPIKYIAIEAGDVINLSFHDREGNPVGYNIYAQQADIGADNTIKVQGVVSDVAVYGITAIGQVAQNHPGGGISGQPITGQPTTLALMDLPPLQDSDDNVGLYWGMCGVGDSAGWSGALLRSVDGGSSYATIGNQNIPSVIGVATTVLPSAPSTHWDTTNTVTVRLISGSMVSVTPPQVLSNQNAFLLGGEICAAASSVQNSDGTYTLSILRRGIRGTDVTSTTHVVGERFVMLSNLGPTLDFIETMGDIGAHELYIGASAGAAPTTQIPVGFIESGRRIMPDPVANACIAYDASSNATISWNPRNRINFEWLDGQEQGVDEAVEGYSIDIYNSGNVVRTITAWSVVTGTIGSVSGADTGRRTASYTAAQQSTDGVTQPITCSIYETSSRIGRGVARTITQ